MEAVCPSAVMDRQNMDPIRRHCNSLYWSICGVQWGSDSDLWLWSIQNTMASLQKHQVAGPDLLADCRVAPRAGKAAPGASAVSGQRR